MHLRTSILISLLISTLTFAPLALAAPGAGGEGGGKPDTSPKPGRLGVPQNVTCTKAGDQLTLSWDAVEGALHYRVYLEASDGGELVDTVTDTPYMHSLSDMTDDPAAEVKGHVRAMMSKMGKGASKPSTQVVCQ
jgi:hypothetical protein